MPTLLEMAISWCQKWVTNNFQNTNYMQPMKRCNMCSQGALVFSFEFREGGKAREEIFHFFSLFPKCFDYVPIKFSICAQVLNVLPNMFPIAPHFNHTLVWLMLLAQVWILFCDSLGSCERKLYLNCMVNIFSLSVIILFNWFCLLIYFLAWPVVDQSVNQLQNKLTQHMNIVV